MLSGASRQPWRQLDDVGHRGIERAQMRERGLAHGLLDQLGPVELLGP
jgi:hypothetical protein